MAISELPIAYGAIAQAGAPATTQAGYKPTLAQIIAAEAATFSNQYNSLLTSEFQVPNFLAMTYYMTQAFNLNTLLLNNFTYDIDSAVGFQLDYIGQWIGFNRNINSVLTGVFFSLDTDGLGFDLGYWQDQYTEYGLTQLGDDDYRQILKLKIAANSWDGSIPSAMTILEGVFPGGGLIIQDNQDMSMTIVIENVVNLVTQGLLNAGYFDLRPAGVSITYSTTTCAFGFDLSTAFVAGFDTGSFV